MAFRQAFLFMKEERDKEILNTFKMRGIIRKMSDSALRLEGMAFNKLLLQWRNDMAKLKDKMRFVIAALQDRENMLVLMAYNGLKQRYLRLVGIGLGENQRKKIDFLKRITDRTHFLQKMTVFTLKEILVLARQRDEELRIEIERQNKEKDKVLRRIMNVN